MKWYAIENGYVLSPKCILCTDTIAEKISVDICDGYNYKLCKANSKKMHKICYETEYIKYQVSMCAYYMKNIHFYEYLLNPYISHIIAATPGTVSSIIRSNRVGLHQSGEHLCYQRS